MHLDNFDCSIESRAQESGKKGNDRGSRPGPRECGVEWEQEVQSWQEPRSVTKEKVWSGRKKHSAMTGAQENDKV